jgi:asparagine synthase (glutamine-hydrolysing)
MGLKDKPLQFLDSQSTLVNSSNMCGFAGIATPDKSSPQVELLCRMSDAVACRGPDGDGMWCSPGIGMAHRRLAIIDLSCQANQPMRDEIGGLTLVFNGEIYNHQELKAELESKGRKFRTRSDTEVILAAYREYGVDFIKKLRGMFALGLWDEARQELLLARDRIGKKPLFYAFTPTGALAFASEIKALESVVKLEPDWQAIRLFLGLQYVPAPLTGFKGVKQLLPSESAVFDGRNLKAEAYHAWPTEKRLVSEEQAAGELLEKLDEAVRIRQLTADVSVGAFLSGGIDSAAVVALASKYVEHPLQTFTMGFPSLSMDERKEARFIADKFGTDHFEFVAKPEDLSNLLDELIGYYDAPYADSSALPLWLLARETAREIKVVMTGDGGDELFGGYRRYTAYDSALRIFGAPLIGTLAPPLGMYYGNLFHDPRYERMAETVRALRLKPETAYGELFCGSYFGTRNLAATFQPDFLRETADSDAVWFVAKKMGSQASLEAAMRFDLTSYLPDDLNVKMDRATMRFGLEARSPFLDQELVDFALRLPIGMKIRGRERKIILRRALKEILPPDVLNRPKRGFQVPLAEWFRGPLKSLIEERCLGEGSPLENIIQRDAVERLVKKNAKGADHGNRLWMLLSLATWLKKVTKK